MFSVGIKGNHVTKLAVGMQVMFTKADVTRKPRGVTHQGRCHAEAWLSAWPSRVHITPEHSSFK
jgi:hypothetical protein